MLIPLSEMERLILLLWDEHISQTLSGVRKHLKAVKKKLECAYSCLHCTYTSPLECSINVHAGHELEYMDLEKIDEKRHVVIVGGGPGGVEAARVLSLKGYDVAFLKRQNQLGGQLRLVSDPVYKKKMNWHCENT